MTLHEFEDISNRIRPKLLTVASRFSSATGGADEADDIAQETLMTLWQLSEKGYPVRDAEALAVKIAKNTCVALYRKAKIRQQPMTGLDLKAEWRRRRLLTMKRAPEWPNRLSEA